jgi:hypothetical protein
MARHGSDANCLQDCCRYPLPQAVVRSSREVKPSLERAPLFTAVPAIPHSTRASFVAPARGDLVAGSPPPLILLQVFRI